LEEERTDALEVAAQAHEEGEAQTPEEVNSSILFYQSFLIIEIALLRLTQRDQIAPRPDSRRVSRQ
jgi:hypothetical protein